MSTSRPGTPDPSDPQRGQQPGKRESEERNDPEVQPGAVEGNPDSRERQRRPREPHDLN